MALEDPEDQLYEEEVKAVKQWWNEARWRYTKRPFTAEQIVAKRGSLRIQYPSNDMSRKLWNIMEGRFKVRFLLERILTWCLHSSLAWRCEFHLWVSRAYHAHANG